jgi:hypothetical protein
VSGILTIGNNHLRSIRLSLNINDLHKFEPQLGRIWLSRYITLSQKGRVA